jgi:DNA primase
LFEFAIRTALAEHDLDSAEGRVSALRRCVPMVAKIKESTLREEYARQLAGWVGWEEVAQVISRVRETAKTGGGAAPRRDGRRPATGGPVVTRLDPRDPTLWPQREALKAALQYPAIAGPVFDTLTVESFTHPAYAAVRAAVAAAGGMSAGLSGGEWIEAVRAQAGAPEVGGMVGELGVEAILVEDDERLPRYIGGVLARLQEVWVGRQIAEMKSKLHRMSPVDQSDDYNALFGDLIALETYRKSLLQQASGDDLTA